MPALENEHHSALLDFLSKHKRWFVLTGAGISTASGLGDYRDERGEWKRSKPMTGQLFLGNELARKRYWARSSVGWKNFSKAEPNEAHFQLVKLQQKGIAHTLITQNVDCLHQKAGHQQVVDLHGVLNLVRCVECQQTLSRDKYQDALLHTNPWLSTLDAAFAPDGDADLDNANFEQLIVPNCAHCDGLLKPDVVFFGENVAKAVVQNAMASLHEADALVVFGSSLMVYSGYRFCKAAHAAGIPILIVTRGTTRADGIASLKINDNCADVLLAINTYYDKT